MKKAGFFAVIAAAVLSLTGCGFFESMRSIKISNKSTDSNTVIESIKMEDSTGKLIMYVQQLYGPSSELFGISSKTIGIYPGSYGTADFYGNGLLNVELTLKDGTVVKGNVNVPEEPSIIATIWLEGEPGTYAIVDKTEQPASVSE